MAADPYKYFRVEARELLEALTQGVLEIEKGAAEQSRINNLLRLAHTLKGAARVVKQPAIAELAHNIEDLLTPYREGARPVPPERPRELFQILDQIGGGLAALTTAPQAPAPALTVNAEEPLETVRVQVEEVEILLGRLSGAGAEFAGIENETEEVRRVKRISGLLLQQIEGRGEGWNGSSAGRMRALAGQLFDSLQRLERKLGQCVERTARELAHTRELANRMRLLPSAALFAPLARTVRDAAVMLGKQVRFEPAGGDIRLDAHVLTIVRDALVQLVRNAVAHGIESPERRVALGKPAEGRVELRIERRGNRVAFLCRDDGSGIDLSAIRRIAVNRGILSAAAANKLGLQEAIDLLLRGGLSTAGRVDEISGRGIGLDIVREAAARLKGEISMTTTPGHGATVEVCVPVSLTSVLALRVASNGVMASLPLDCVRQTARFERAEIACCGAQESIVHQGKPIPFLPLSSALGAAEPDRKMPERGSLVVVAWGAELAAIGVDHLAGTETVLVRALPALAPATNVVNGATLDNEGHPQLFLDPAGLIEAALRGQQQKRTHHAPAAPVLVIDDSLTTRTVEQSILESAGYQVDVATSGEEALEKALGRAYSLFLVDVEMPGMDGFEFVARARADAKLQNVPAILVTSRGSPEDRRRGAESGAGAYIVKGEFDQGHFLQTVEQLVNA